MSNTYSTCKECGADVRWFRESGSGRWRCVNEDGTDHWDLCSKLRHQRIVRTGEYFDHGEESGYRTPFKRSGVHYMHQTGRGEQGRGPSGLCKCCTLPWEQPCRSCPDILEAA